MEQGVFSQLICGRAVATLKQMKADCHTIYISIVTLERTSVAEGGWNSIAEGSEYERE